LPPFLDKKTQEGENGDKFINLLRAERQGMCTLRDEYWCREIQAVETGDEW